MSELYIDPQEEHVAAKIKEIEAEGYRNVMVIPRKLMQYYFLSTIPPPLPTFKFRKPSIKLLKEDPHHHPTKSPVVLYHNKSTNTKDSLVNWERLKISKRNSSGFVMFVKSGVKENNINPSKPKFV